MEHEHVISGLVRKRAETAGHLDVAHAKVAELIATLEHLDATLRLFEPKIDLANVRVRPTPGRLLPLYGELNRLVFGVLRDAAEPMTVRAITLIVMGGAGLATDDTELVDSMRGRVGQALRTARNRGQAKSGAGEDMQAVWRLVT